jgi:hypothetical protein
MQENNVALINTEVAALSVHPISGSEVFMYMVMTERYDMCKTLTILFSLKLITYLMTFAFLMWLGQFL